MNCMVKQKVVFKVHALTKEWSSKKGDSLIIESFLSEPSS